VSWLCLAHHAVRLWCSPRRWPHRAFNTVQIRCLDAFVLGKLGFFDKTNPLLTTQRGQRLGKRPRYAMFCCMLQCAAVCCSVLQCVAVCCSVSQCVTVCCGVLQCVAVRCSVLQCVAVCCSVLIWTFIYTRTEGSPKNLGYILSIQKGPRNYYTGVIFPWALLNRQDTATTLRKIICGKRECTMGWLRLVGSLKL